LINVHYAGYSENILSGKIIVSYILVIFYLAAIQLTIRSPSVRLVMETKTPFQDLNWWQ